RHVRDSLVERLLVSLDLIGFERGIDQELGLLRQRGRGPRESATHCDAGGALPPTLAYQETHCVLSPRIDLQPKNATPNACSKQMRSISRIRLDVPDRTSIEPSCARARA